MSTTELMAYSALRLWSLEIRISTKAGGPFRHFVNRWLRRYLECPRVVLDDERCGRRRVSYVAADRCEDAIGVGPSLALGSRAAAFTFKRKLFWGHLLLWTKGKVIHSSAYWRRECRSRWCLSHKCPRTRTEKSLFLM